MTIASMYRASARRRGGTRLARARRGFTLVELIVALLILTVGLMALVGTSISVTKQMSMSVRRTEAATIAERRFETIRSRNQLCSSITGSTRTWPRGITEKWVVASVPAPASVTVTINGAVTVTDTITFVSTKSRPTKIVFQSVIACELPVPT